MTKRLKSIEEAEQYFPGFMAFRLYRARNTKTKEQVKKKTVLLWKEKEAHGKEPILSEPKESDNLQNKAQTDR